MFYIVYTSYILFILYVYGYKFFIHVLFRISHIRNLLLFQGDNDNKLTTKKNRMMQTHANIE